MALVACVEYRKKISELAKICPNCGHPDPIPKVNDRYSIRVDGKIYKRFIVRIDRDRTHVLDSCRNCRDNYWAFMQHENEHKILAENKKCRLRFFVKCMSCGEIKDATVELYGYKDERVAETFQHRKYIYDDGVPE